MLSKAESRPKVKIAPRGTPRKGKRMANVLKAILKPTSITSPAVSKVIGSSFSTPVAESVSAELKAIVSLRASLDSDTTSDVKVYSITDVVREEDQEKLEASQDEGSTKKIPK